MAALLKPNTVGIQPVGKAATVQFITASAPVEPVSCQSLLHDFFQNVDLVFS